jgi:glycosyltransferase involved in cell wall biosynthesis
VTTTPNPEFSLIVATYGRADVLRALVTSLLAQTHRDFEVIIADQNSDNRVAPEVEPLLAEGLLAAHIRLPEPNLSQARNAGLARARGRFVAFPDDDCWYEPDTLALAAARFASPSHPDGLAARWLEAPAEFGDQVVGPIPASAIRCFRAGNVASITLFLDRKATIDAGGFDVRFGVGRWYGSGEETDLVMAMIANGARISHAPEVVVHHPFDPEGSRALSLCRERSRARGAGALYAKHRLPAWVIARGLLAPLIAWPGLDLAVGAATSLGRMEGFARWHISERCAGSVPSSEIGKSWNTTTSVDPGATSHRDHGSSP